MIGSHFPSNLGMRKKLPASRTKGNNPDVFGKLKKRWNKQIAEQHDLSSQRRSALLNNGATIFEKYSIKKVFLFGSVLEKKCTINSDIDILLIPLNDADYWKIRFDLEEAIGFPIDIYSQSDDPQFVKKIMGRGEMIYET